MREGWKLRPEIHKSRFNSQPTRNQVFGNHLLDTWFQFFIFSTIPLLLILQHPHSERGEREDRRIRTRKMGCSFSGLNALYDSVNGGGDVWINENRFRIVRQLGEGGFAYVYLVKEVLNDSAAGGLGNKLKDSSHISGSLLHSLITFSLILPKSAMLGRIKAWSMRSFSVLTRSAMTFHCWNSNSFSVHVWFNFRSVEVDFWFVFVVFEFLLNAVPLQGIGVCDAILLLWLVLLLNASNVRVILL